MYSLIIPVYKNKESINDLIQVLQELNSQLSNKLEVVFVIDGSPDNSYELIKEKLPEVSFKSKLLSHSRNFGSFVAIKNGLAAATGDYFAVMAADLQEPPELALEFFKNLESDQCDIGIGTRSNREDPALSKIFADSFWYVYRKLIEKNIPPGGVDIFACNRKVRDQLVKLNESNTSLIGLIFWVGFRRKLVSYERKARQYGKSAWTFKKKLNYLMDSVFAFSDLPIRVLTFLGTSGVLITGFLGFLVLIAKVFGFITVPGYAALALMILFFSALNLLTTGIIGSYVWRAYENTKGRPNGIVMAVEDFNGK